MAAMAPPPLKYIPCHRPDGLVSEEALRIIVEAKACFVALALALAYLLTASQHRLWSSSHLIKAFLFVVTQPVTRFLVSMFTMLLAMPFRNDLYLLWGILLLAGYEGVYTISGYCVSVRHFDFAIHEFARAYNIVLVGLYVRYYSRASQFRYPLWALWSLMVAKFVDRIFRFKVANGRYGDASTQVVTDYMRHEDKVPPSPSLKTTTTPTTTTTGSQDFFSMKYCNYLVMIGKTTVKEGINKYEAEYMPADNTVTVAKVWNCGGKLFEDIPKKKRLLKNDVSELKDVIVSNELKKDGNVSNELKKDVTDSELKDVCLSFALCKLLRRQFTGVPAAGSEKTKAQQLVFDNLLKSGWERTFRVVRTELGFARDLMYTNYPILFSSGFPIASTVLFSVTIAVSVWITVSAVRHYRVPRGSTSYVVHGKNVDLIITFTIVGMFCGMEICQFFIHLFSDWTKVMVISEYVRKPSLQQRPFLNILLRLVCSGKIAETIGTSIGQFDLLRVTKKRHLLERVIVRSFVRLTGGEDFRIMNSKTRREMIWKTLVENKQELFDGQERLQKRSELEGRGPLAEFFRAPATAIETIMVWHVATSELAASEQDGRRRSKGSSRRSWCGTWPPANGTNAGGAKIVATTLSKYCAYLLFYKPKLLPIANNSVRFLRNKLVDEAKTIKGKKGGNGEESNGNQVDAGIVSRGRELAEKLPKCVEEPGGAWEALAKVWCELIISMAPQGNIGLHQKELGKGGEFITHLWALLYHAGIDDKFSASSNATSVDASATRDDHNSQNTICSAVA